MSSSAGDGAPSGAAGIPLPEPRASEESASADAAQYGKDGGLQTVAAAVTEAVKAVNGSGSGSGSGSDHAEPSTTTAAAEGQQGDEHEQEGMSEEEEEDPAARIASLESELDRVTDDKNKLESQYRNLLGKLTSMRNTLGDKLAQDAEELDRREAQIADLQASNDDLEQTIETLRAELIASNDEAERLHSSVEQLRLRADEGARASVDEGAARELQLRELVEDLERARLEREDWENQALKERVERETLQTALNAAERELATLRLEKNTLRHERDREATSAANLHNVLEEFQAAKDRELAATLGDLQTQLQHTSRSMQEYKQRAAAAESKLAASNSDSERCTALQKEVKEKNIFIGKLRHEGELSPSARYTCEQMPGGRGGG